MEMGISVLRGKNDMSEYYIQHYFNFKNAGSFMLVAFSGLAVVLAVILLLARRQQANAREYVQRVNASGHHMDSKKAARAIRRRPYILIESFYEMVFSSTSILLFLAIYYILDSRYTQVSPYWEKYQDVFLLFFLIMSVVVTNMFDLILVNLTHLKSEQKGAVRLVSSLYVVLILLYIRFIYNDTNYNSLILYFVTLFLGRFVYFDFTLKDFKNLLSGVTRNLPLLGLMLAYSAVVCWYGFKVDFLLTSNGVIISTLIAHLFMDLSIIIVHKTKLVKAFIE